MIDIRIGFFGTLHCRRLKDLLRAFENVTFREDDMFRTLLNTPHIGHWFEFPLRLGETVDTRQHGFTGLFELLNQE